MNHFFFWHLPVDLRVVYFLKRKYGELSIYPLSYSACVANRIMNEQSVYCCADLISPAVQEALMDQAMISTDQYFDHAAKYSYLFALGADGEAVCNALYYVKYFRALTQRIKEERGDGQFIQYPYVAAGAVHGSMLQIQRYLDLVIDEANGHIGLGRRNRWQAFRARRLVSLQALSLLDDVFIARPSLQFSKPQPVDVLILALEESDRRSQAPLVKRLADRGVSLKWCCVMGNRMAVSEDEERLESSTIDPGLIHELPQNFTEGYAWKWHYPISLNRQVSCHQMNECLQQTEMNDASPLLRWRLAQMLSSGGSSRSLIRKALADLIAIYLPKLVVMSSSYGVMSEAQAFLSEINIPVVRLPHGVENILQATAKWRCSAIGQFGPLDVELLRAHHPKRASTFHAVGGYHLGQQALHDHAKKNEQWPQGSLRFLYPVSYGLLFYPDTQLDIEKDSLAMGQAAKQSNAELVIRCHPRQRNWDYFDYVLMKQYHGAKAHWTLSDGSESLVQALQMSHIILIRTWSGSAMQALYANRPIIAWMPRKGFAYSDHVLSQFPVRASNGEELAEAFRRLIDDEAYRGDILKQQKALLEYVVKDPYGDPYAGAEELVLDALREVKGE